MRGHRLNLDHPHVLIHPLDRRLRAGHLPDPWLRLRHLHCAMVECAEPEIVFALCYIPHVLPPAADIYSDFLFHDWVESLEAQSTRDARERAAKY